jgi:glycopeptide antibiotics resistance protein
VRVTDQVALGLLAIFIGLAAGVALFVPFVAISYRRRGTLRMSRVALWGAALVYFWAIWTYTLLPLPDPDALRCAGVNLNPLELVTDVETALTRSGPWIADPGVLQLMLNVLLFVPLGFFVRVLGGRGILIAGLVGLAFTVFIETTQLTGVWGLYPCAYRVFDVDDMITNTTGALLGSLTALVVPARLRGVPRLPDADQPRPVTRGRRALAMLCDGIGFWMLALVVGLGVQLVLQLVAALTGDAALAQTNAAGIVGTVAAVIVWVIVGLVTGRSIGDLSVMLRYEGGPFRPWLARPLRIAGGVVGYTALDTLPDPWSLLSGVFLLAMFLTFFWTKNGRGLPGLLSGQRLADARSAAIAPAETPAPRP